MDASTLHKRERMNMTVQTAQIVKNYIGGEWVESISTKMEAVFPSLMSERLQQTPRTQYHFQQRWKLYIILQQEK